MVKRLFIPRTLILVVFALMPFWKALPNAPKPFSATYVLGFPVTLAMLATLISWVLMGLPNIQALVKRRWNIVWGLGMILWISWGYISQFWAFERTRHPEIAQNIALQLTIVGLFALCVLCCVPSTKTIFAILLGVIGVNLCVGAMQVALQHQVGLTLLGELKNLNPQQSGVSVVQYEAVRWLRPYGLVPHPNIFAGFALIGCFATLPLLTHEKRLGRVMGLIYFGISWWMLLLSFSRGAWVACAVASLAILPMLLRQFKNRGWLVTTLAVMGGLGILFFALYRPFIFARAGVGEENTELRSISDRVVFTEIAFEVIQRAPFQGIGAGNFPWYASDYLYYRTDYDLRGTNVHQIALTVISELGLIGFGLFASLLSIAIGRGFYRAWHTQYNAPIIAILASVVALAIIGLVDHYPYTLVHMLALWFAFLAIVQADYPTLAH